MRGAATTWYLLTKAFGGDLFDADFKPLFTDPASAGYLAMAFEIVALNEGLIDPAATSLKDVEVQELFKAGKASFDVAGWAGNLAVYTDPAKISGGRRRGGGFDAECEWQIADVRLAGGFGDSGECRE